jgi:hypothetical protein
VAEGGSEAQIGRSEPRTSEDALEGGAVEPLQDYPIAEQHRAHTARYLAYALVATLALSVVFQYASTMILIYTGKTDAIPNLDKTFNILMPLLSGLVGGAATYYFTREKR